MDETYVVRSHKGTKIEEINGKKRGTSASKRGLSGEQVCLLTAVERFGESITKAYNMAKPSSNDILKIKDHIEENTFIWTDGLASYNALIEEKHCSSKIVKTKDEYDSVNHLNNVNSYHSKIQKQYSKYRGVASKYINRYAALFDLQREYAGMDKQEYLLLILKRLRKICIKFYIRQINKDDLFTLAF